ncbi:aspartyl/asparaginyl beta-hydroxylase domain-containing protein [Parasphingopyxis sp.]|uniref:aspartyl/asparaginyl beta-hydroxylase domain-containing protein n=1 Tax=Parasphingopyxis sp. TaxID=1920299 RepID=UPI0032EB3C50
MASQTPNDLPQDLRDAMALLPGDPQGAREKARAGLAAPSPDPRYWIIAGQASRMLEDWQDLENVADSLLDVAPNAIMGLIWKADCLAMRKELRIAGPFYAAALRAAKDSGPLPQATVADLERAEGELQEIGRIYAFHLESELAKHGFTTENTSRNFAETFATLAGTHQPRMEQQRPTVLYYPGLPQKPFYERAEFDWVERLEAATDDIRAELAPILADPENFRPYVTGEETGPARDYHGMLDNSDWTSFYLWADGSPVAENVERCPKTAAILETLPRAQFPDRCPTAIFSRLTPGAHIPPHHGMLNTRLICHLPLIVPEGCALKVGGEERVWEEGKLVIFDDSIEHEAWNSSDRDRVVLLFDIARPEIGEQDRAALSALFAAVDSFR